MALEHTLESPLANAVRTVGGQSAFARLICRSQSFVHGLLRDSKQLPAEHVLPVEAATGISKHDLRPDIYPRPESSATIAQAPSGFEHAR